MNTFKGKKIPSGYSEFSFTIIDEHSYSGCIKSEGCWKIISCADCVFHIRTAGGITYDFLVHIGEITKEKRLELLLDRGI